MRQFDLNNKVNPEKVFILQSSEIEKRLDPFYYVPSIRKLEEQVKKHKPEPLRKHILSVSSGATPKTTEKEKYYSDKENGIPFLRVQNLSPTGILDIENCKYINKETHENYLKRSQVEGGDLLVKITGVGRMAVASVAPDGFIGNTNQHMVVIKTGSKEKSELLAAYLNTDIAERLASRRATGGTRPALDYPALLSIPIILDEKILEIRNKAIEIKQRKEQEADKLLSSIDDYLLNELGIELPKQDNSLIKRIFRVNYSNLSGNRFDPFYHKLYFKEIAIALKNGKYKLESLNNICDLMNGYAFKSKDYVRESNTLNIRMSNIRPNNRFDLDYNKKYLPDEYFTKYNQFKLEDGDIIIAMTDMASDPKILGVPTIVKNPKKKQLLLNQRVGKLININKNKVDLDYLKFVLSSSFVKEYYNQQGARGVQINLSREQILSAKIPLPKLNKQIEICEYIKDLRAKANSKQKEAKDALKLAKKEIEHLILGEL